MKRGKSTAGCTLAIACTVLTTVIATVAIGDPTTVATPDGGLLHRHYQLGQILHYHMTTSNTGRQGTLRYQVDADGVVKKDPSGTYYEEFAWSNLVVNGQSTPLPPESAGFRQQVSLASLKYITVPDLSHVYPMLIGPITDLLTFYADTITAMQSKELVKPGDHVYVKVGKPASWADGTYFTLAQDSIDFDLTLKDVNQDDGIATVVIKHVPPAVPQISLPADWLKTPVGDTPNNWVEVQKTPQGTYIAEVGKETFDVEIKVSLDTGAIVSAKMDNLVEISERPCADASLTPTGDPVRYDTVRHVEIR